MNHRYQRLPFIASALIAVVLAIGSHLPAASARDIDTNAFKMPKVAPWPKTPPQIPPQPEEKDIPALTARAEAGDADAGFQLARWYAAPVGEKREARDSGQAEKWNRKAADAGHPQALFAQALMRGTHALNEDDPEALALLTRAADGGASGAAWFLARHYQTDSGNAPDIPKAVHWYRKAVESGSPQAAIDLGNLYYPVDTRHFKIAPDIVLGYAWRVIGQSGLAAAEKEATAAGRKTGPEKHRLENNLEELAIISIFMLPSEKKQAQAILAAWPKKLPPEGNLEPLKENEPEFLEKMPDEQAAALLDNAARGEKPALEAAVSAIAQGKIGNNLKKESIAILKKASDAGISNATTLLGLALVHDGNSEEQIREGIAILKAQAEKGDARACYYLGGISAEKRDGGKAETIHWLEKGAAIGSTNCMLLLAYEYRSAGDRKKAAWWYEQAAKRGNTNALMELISIAESDSDFAAIGKWLSLVILRVPDPMMAYRSRMMLAYVYHASGEKGLAKIMEKAEKWHKANPLPAGKP